MTSVANGELTRSTEERLQRDLCVLLARRRLVVLEHAAGSAQRELAWLDQRITELRRLLGGADQGAPSRGHRRLGSVPA